MMVVKIGIKVKLLVCAWSWTILYVYGC